MSHIVEKIRNNEVYIIAEMSANHGGSLDNALELVRQVAKTGADCLKIQTYTADSMTINCDKDYFKIKGGLWDGYNLYDLYKEASTPYEWQGKIKEECEKLGLDFLSTPFDRFGVDFLEGLGVDAYKIASFELVDIPLIEYVASKGKPMIISTGMGSIREIWDALNACKSQGNDQIVILKCCSEYPAPWGDMHLGNIPDMKNRFCVPVGLSDHSVGGLGAVVGVSLGACVVEKHVKLDGVESADSEFSMTMEEFSKMVIDVRNAKMISNGPNYELTEGEKSSTIFRRSIFAVKDIKTGDKISRDNIRVLRPSYGMKPKYYNELLGTYCLNDITKGEPIHLEDVAISDIDVLHEDFEIRNVKIEDIDLLFEWANDSLARRNAFNTKQIPYENHKKWFYNLIEDTSQKQYIFMKNEKPIGQIRFSIMNETEAEIDYSIDSSFRGHGYGKIMLELAIKQFHIDYPYISILIGKVKTGNGASAGCFINCGFEEHYKQFEYRYEE